MALELPVPDFVEIDPQAILLDLVNKYQIDTGVTLQPAQIEQIILNCIAYRTQLNLEQINTAGKQGLIDYSTAPILDYLAANLGVTRLPPSLAVCKIRFTLVNGHGALTIPQGLRVQSLDGQVFFSTDVATNVDATTNVVDINCSCNVEGVIGNNYAVGNINIILDPQVYLLTASNIEISGGGGGLETDEELRDRYKLRLSTFSTAGAKNAYKFYAKSVSSAIVDVAVKSPFPGTVYIYPLMDAGGAPTQAILDAVFNACNVDNVRPLTDTVAAISPTFVNFDININATLLDTADSAITLALMNTALNAYRVTLYSRLGLDVVINEIKRLAKVLGIYDLNVTSPAANIVIAENEVAVLGGVNITFTGTNAG